MKPFLVALWSMGTMAFISIQHINIYVTIVIQFIIGVLTIVYLIRKIRSLK